jgi:hypothetical protein
VYVEIGQSFEAVYAHGAAGLVPGIEVAIFDGDGNVVEGPTGLNISEEMLGATPLGVYTWNAPAAPGTEGQYSIIWSPDGTWDAETNSTADELVVVALGADTLPPLPAPVGGGIGPGPCTAWTTSLAIAVCKGVPNSNAYDDAIAAASEILYELSARRFPGLCERTVRPCQTSGSFCGIQILSRGYVIHWGDNAWVGYDCGCHPLSSVELVGKPATSITEVLIDGVALDPSEYRLDQQQYLVRLNGGMWPACQRLDLPDTEEGTWSVTYQHGQAIPVSGQMAARDLAYEIYRSCSATDLEGDCELPEGVTRITRQGISYELPALVSWGRDFQGIWRTGMRLVDAFLNAYNPRGLQRRPILYVPGAPKQARKVGS